MAQLSAPLYTLKQAGAGGAVPAADAARAAIDAARSGRGVVAAQRPNPQV
ncbi:hypothetical protein NF701_08495 [Sphingomonadaceae bacterium OTU29THOMA1]|nr:hypothetical protein NF701_08495 [Sphingomonadaceae bacterium OTU29THOMA1]